MKIHFWPLLFLSVLLIGCHRQTKKPPQSKHTAAVFEVPETIVSNAKVLYNHKTSLWTLNNQPFSGFVVGYYPDGGMKEKYGIVHGKKQNEAMQWYPDGHLKIVANYHKGKLHGEKKIWSADSEHVLIAQFNYDTGKAHGEQKKWYSSGQLFKRLHLNRGKEEGLQQAFRKNGVLYANYEAKEGRIFGLKKAALCYGLEDESVRYKK